MTTLAEDIEDWTIAFAVEAGYPAMADRIAQVGSEYMRVRNFEFTGVIAGLPLPEDGPGVVMADRGFLGSSPSAHPSGTQVRFVQFVVQTDQPPSPPPASVSPGAVATELTDTTFDVMFSPGDNGSVNLEATDPGVMFTIKASDGEGDEAPVGGEIILTTGRGYDGGGGGDGGNMTLTTGPGGVDGDGGSIVIQTGDGPDGEGGDIDIRVGSSNSGVGGDISIVAGTGQTGSGGDVIIQAGGKVTGGSHGSVQLYGGSGAVGVDVGNTFAVTGAIVFHDLPTSDPGVPGQLWNDAGAVKVSAG